MFTQMVFSYNAVHLPANKNDTFSFFNFLHRGYLFVSVHVTAINFGQWANWVIANSKHTVGLLWPLVSRCILPAFYLRCQERSLLS